jgi:CheY-like chemotaxis protein
MLVFFLGSASLGPPTTRSEVLLVEDNAGDALLIRQALAESLISVRLHIARDGEQALQILGERDFEPDLIILDLNLPKLSGYSVLAFCLKKTPVVVFTESLNETDEGRAMSLGAREFVRKPMELHDYKTAVCRMVRKWTAPRDNGEPVLLSV